MLGSTSPRTIRVGVASEHSLARRGLVHLLEEADIVVVAEAGDGEGALRIAVDEGPDVLIVALEMPGLGGLEVARLVARDRPDVGVVVLAPDDDPRTAGEIARSGALGIVSETDDTPELVETVRLVASGHAVMDPRSWKAPRRLARLEQVPSTPSEREMVILRMIADGYSNGQAAEALGLSPETVKTYVERICRRLGANDRIEAVARALRAGLIE